MALKDACFSLNGQPWPNTLKPGFRGRPSFIGHARVNNGCQNIRDRDSSHYSFQ